MIQLEHLYVFAKIEAKTQRMCIQETEEAWILSMMFVVK